ncbi:MAG: LuxR C-terminal-related transcriptional regulator [Slackia sp.]|uniref:helix-turn-helix transcriptional regulator n=1 Tax=uncultured Slackia sp. TaxID=665903 RepID=UPI0028062A21|nr:LuxR C-terminal-related transcriptional regulator [uncultured Slackia sp.]MDU6011505.1 LuxR C-terminal-related transcriptional regulator [Slackia sp.]
MARSVFQFASNTDQLLAHGRTVPEVCEELSIARGTAKHHVSNIYRKVGVYDRRSLLDVVGTIG